MAHTKFTTEDESAVDASGHVDASNGAAFDYEVIVKVPARKNTEIHKSTVRIASEAVEKAALGGVHVIEVGPSSLGIGTAFTDDARAAILNGLDASLKAVGLKFADKKRA